VTGQRRFSRAEPRRATDFLDNNSFQQSAIVERSWAAKRGFISGMLGTRQNFSVVRLGRRRIFEVSPSVALRHALPLVSQLKIGTVKRHASFPGGQFPGIRIPGQQPPEKGATLKQYVSEPYLRLLPLVPELIHNTVFTRASTSLSSRSKANSILPLGGMKVGH